MLVRRIARPLLSTIFISGGIDALRSPTGRAKLAAPFIEKSQDVLPNDVTARVPSDPETLVKINAAVQIGGGVLLATGKAPRIASLALAGSLVPTTLAGHAFWNESDPAKKAAQRTQFFKNVSLLGGLLIAAVDTEGKPSLAWKGRRAAHKASDAVASALPSDSSTDPSERIALAGNKVKSIAGVAATKATPILETAATKVSPLLETAAHRVSPLLDTASEKGTKLAHIAADRGTELAHKAADVAADKGSDFAETAQKRGAKLADIAADRGSELAGTAQKRGLKLAEKAQDRGSKWADIAADRGAELADTAQKRSQDWAANIASQTETLGKRARKRADKESKVLAKRSEEARKELDKQVEKTRKQLEKKLSKLQG